MTTTQVRERRDRIDQPQHAWTPLTGLAAVVAVIVSVIVAGQPPEAGSTGSAIATHYSSNETSIQIASMVSILAGVLLITFGAYLRTVLAASEGRGGMLSVLVLVGAAVIAVGGAIDATISFALVEAAGDVDPVAMQALQALWDCDFAPLQLGALIVLIAGGLSAVRHATIPTWLGWVALVLAVVGFTPIGYVAFGGLGLWIATVSILLAVRAAPAP